MKISYEAGLADYAEPSVRLYLRSQACATQRWRGAVLCAGVFGGFAFLGFHAKETVNIFGVCAAAGVWGAGLFILTYTGAVRRRIANYIAGETKGPWPRTTAYEVDQSRLISTCAGATRSFNLSDFAGIREDSKRLELNFGAKGLCVIPLRAFDSTDEKAAFLNALSQR